ncbi:glycerate kinase [Catenulispora pinistramenti]|uniref:glycerate kinase n=1 Tax=Catenulispora pinistramenti TaxID=2705254 RepID=UPI001E3646BD|nr:glycerate kinase [Catenulispora pinistramenti]
MPQSSAGHILLATDKFKGSLSAAEATSHLAAGLRRASPALGIRTIPVADGGEGTVAAAVEAGFAPVLTRATGPTGAPIEAGFAVRGDTAVIEVAEASGLRRLPRGEAAPLSATSYGTGQLIRAALEAGCTRVILGLGGSACTDGGAGLVQALGARLLDAAGQELPRGGAALARLARIDVGEMAAVRELIVASDVDNPLLGPNGAAAIYGPQKGATAEDVALLDAALANWARLVQGAVGGRGFGPGLAGARADGARASGSGSGLGSADADAGSREIAAHSLASARASVTGSGPADVDAGSRQVPAHSLADAPADFAQVPGAGAAGGIGFAAMSLLGARLEPGIDIVLDLADFATKAHGARLVITGEGSLDRQSLRGKAPAGVARAAARAGVPVVAVAGVCTLTPAELEAAGIRAAYTLSGIEPDLERCILDAGPLLEQLAAVIAADALTGAAV